MKVWRAVQLLALLRLRERVPEEPPIKLPMEPEYESEAPMAGVEVPTD